MCVTFFVIIFTIFMFICWTIFYLSMFDSNVSQAFTLICTNCWLLIQIVVIIINDLQLKKLNWNFAFFTPDQFVITFDQWFCINTLNCLSIFGLFQSLFVKVKIWMRFLLCVCLSLLCIIWYGYLLHRSSDDYCFALVNLTNRPFESTINHFAHHFVNHHHHHYHHHYLASFCPFLAFVF